MSLLIFLLTTCSPFILTSHTSTGMEIEVELQSPVKPPFSTTICIPQDGGVTLTTALLDSELIEYDYSLTRDFAPANGEEYNIKQPNIAEVKILGILRDYRVAGITVFPYRKTRNGIKFYKKILLKISFEKPAIVNKYLLYSRFEDLYNNIILNHQHTKEWIAKREEKMLDWKPDGVKLEIREDGLYRVTYEELLDAGISLSGFNPTTIKLKNLSKEIPIFVWGEDDGSFNKGDYIEFYGKFPRGDKTYFHPYTQSNVYWLSYGGSSGQRLVKESGRLKNPERELAYAFTCTLHIEEDKYFSRHASDDYWFYELASMGEIVEVEFDIESPDSISLEPTRVIVDLYGRTDYEHNAIHTLGNYYIGTANWWGVYPHTFEAEGPTNNLLQGGKNKYQLICQGSEDYIYLNFIELIYKRTYRVIDNYIEFRSPGVGVWEFRLEGFTSPGISLYRLEHSKFTEFEVEFNELDSTYTLIFEDKVYTDTKYIALTNNQKKIPDITIPSYGRDITTIEQADYVIITYDSLKEACERYKEFRKNEYSVEIVTCEEIYDYFGYGIISADAIRDFIKFSFSNWNTSICLLVGDGVHNKHIPYGTSGNLIPVKLEDTEMWGYTASDNFYACVCGEDLLPDIMIGRLPLRTEDEVDLYLSQVIEYEEEPEYGGWKRNLLFISGVGGVGYTTFREQIKELIKYVPPWFIPSHIDATISTSSDVIEEINEGRSLVLFKGHGGGGIWSDNSILDIDDLNFLNNGGMLPCVLSFTCFTTAFDGGASLGEEFVKNGGLCCFGATGVGWFLNDMFMAEELLLKIWDRNLGAAILSSKLSYISKYYYWGHLAYSQVKQYLLLGDPALNLNFPDTTSLDVSPKYVDVGGNITISSMGEMDFDISSNGVIHYRDTIIGETTITLPEEIEGRNMVRGYLFDTDEAGINYITIGAPYIGEPIINPESPISGDSVWISAIIKYPETIPVKLTYWKRGSPSTEIPMVDDSLYTTTSPIYVYSGDSIYYYITAGEETSNTFSFYVPKLADLVVESYASFNWQEGIYLSTTVKNLGETTAESVTVEAYLHLCSLEIKNNYVLRDTVYIPPDSFALATFPWNLPSGIYLTSFAVDPDSEVEEEEEGNNVSDTFEIWADIHPVTDTGCCFTSIDENIYIEIPPGIVSTENAVWIDGEDFTSTYQPDISPVPLPGHPEGWVYSLSLGDTSQMIDGGRITFLTYDTLIDYAIYSWYDDRWNKLLSTADSTTIYANLFLPGKFTLIRSNDDIPPSVEVMADGRILRDGGLVSDKPKIDIVFEDINGIDPQSIVIFIDSLQYEVICNSSTQIDQSTSLVLSFSPQLDEGRHFLYSEGKDCNGNRIEARREFEVKGKLDILSFGNYPNPVRAKDKKTVFAFLLSNRADELEVTIYTIAGRRIWKYTEYFPSADWEKISWDLMDDRMRPVANGVYFYEVIVKKGDKMLKRQGKLAILK